MTSLGKRQSSQDLAGELRAQMRSQMLCEEAKALETLRQALPMHTELIPSITERAADWVKQIRSTGSPGLMEVFLAEYGLSSKEGVALMCLAEALLRVPDAETIDALIEDKIAPSDWASHAGHSSSPLVNASTWALMLTGSVLRDEGEGVTKTLRGLVKRLGEPVIRRAVGQAMREMGQQFVLGQDINAALRRAEGQERKGYTYSYDMLGEAARTHEDAERYFSAYQDAIDQIASACRHEQISDNPGISVKLSALHPRYEATHAAQCKPVLIDRLSKLVDRASKARMGLNIDAEEADRLDLSLDIIEAVLASHRHSDWSGFGIVVQAYGQRAPYVIDWLHNLAVRLDRKIMVRLVKGAYWDTEIKRAQTLGLSGFPVFTRKASTDLSFLACAHKLLSMTDHIYPQFATHNAHTMAAVSVYAEYADIEHDRFEFQRLHGMGETLHGVVMNERGTRSRIYAPVGAHEDLLAYLVRRLLENGANSSFVNQIVNNEVDVSEIVADPVDQLVDIGTNASNPNIRHPNALYGVGRVNARGWDITNLNDQAEIDAAIQAAPERFEAGPLLAKSESSNRQIVEVRNPADPAEVVGQVALANSKDVDAALEAASGAAAVWGGRLAKERADMLRRTADLYEENFGTFFTLATREAGKNALDRVAELREAVDFLRYYASEAERLSTDGELQGRGVFACISPWNFPLAIFTGQISAALAAGNAVIAKPAEQTPLIAHEAIKLFHQASIPSDVLQLLPGDGAEVGGALTSDPRIDGVCFTGSTPTAQAIHRAMAVEGNPSAPLIAETGGLNAMIVDSSALPEQAVRDIVASAFQSAGQRCSALRILYVQVDIAEKLTNMLIGAMAALNVGDPADMTTDVGPVIDYESKVKIDDYIADAATDGRVINASAAPQSGTFIAPTLIRVSGIVDLSEEIFGPVLHVATYEADNIDRVIAAINSKGYGLTFGLHTRIDDRVQHIVDTVRCGNIYINRNQIGAIVGSQPFGGEGLSGTGPKAGGPNYLQRFVTIGRPPSGDISTGVPIDREIIQLSIDEIAAEWKETRLATHHLPGPTGEDNRLRLFGRGVILCLGPSATAAHRQAELAIAKGCTALSIVPGLSGAHCLDGCIEPHTLAELSGFSAVAFWGEGPEQREFRKALAQREGHIIPLLTDMDFSPCQHERHVCIDTTAAGGNASLLAAAE